ncbi:MAG TPA: tol-pal system-associated acyl-CoA thioesterase [Devosiaceae bacterium]|jgi:acyl-CoA thioester hydrolase|nr:tol-pal system-associated acyl-CoA thioesterase [Devosiaceae bacterium]
MMALPDRFEVRVYYEDTDFSGNVYHAAYLKFLERARTEFLRAHGVHHFELAREGLAFAVRSMQIDFEAAAHIDDMLMVQTVVIGATGARLMLEQTVFRDETRLVEARLVVVAINRDGRAARLPKPVLALAAGVRPR